MKHRIIAMTHFGFEFVQFSAFAGFVGAAHGHFTPQLVINSVRGAVASAVEGRGVTRLLSCQVAEQVAPASLRFSCRR